MLAWLCLLGWLLLITLIIYGNACLSEFAECFNIWGTKSKDTNWLAVNILVAFTWIISIVLKVAIFGWL
jgi:hypothetical protein